MKKCYLCGTAKEELRPYGAKGQDICFSCAMETPERKRETETQFENQLSFCAELIALSALAVLEAVQMQGENDQRKTQGYSPAWVPGCGYLTAGTILQNELFKRGIMP